MPKPRAQEPRDQQLLIRVTARQQTVLEAIAHLERTTPNRYAHQVLVDHLAGMTRNPRVATDIDNRAAYASDLAGTSPFRSRAGPEADQIADSVGSNEP